jgi:hypothetical protein
MMFSSRGAAEFPGEIGPVAAGAEEQATRRAAGAAMETSRTNAARHDDMGITARSLGRMARHPASAAAVVKLAG